MTEDLIYYIIQTFTFIIFIMDIFVAVTSNIRNAGKFIHRLRYWVYSVTPAMYIIMLLSVWIIAEIFNLDIVFAMIMILMLVSGCCIAYAGKFFTRKKAKKSDKKCVCANKQELCVKSEYAEELTPLTERKDKKL